MRVSVGHVCLDLFFDRTYVRYAFCVGNMCFDVCILSEICVLSAFRSDMYV